MSSVCPWLSEQMFDGLIATSRMLAITAANPHAQAAVWIIRWIPFSLRKIVTDAHIEKHAIGTASSAFHHSSDNELTYGDLVAAFLEGLGIFAIIFTATIAVLELLSSKKSQDRRGGGP
jgi:hypothetical protein